MEIRKECSDDIEAVRRVNDAAFQQDQEGRIVDALRENDGVLLSLVALVDGRVVGHILYSPATVGPFTGAALGPMAVDPDYQRRGIGSRLVETGNAMLAESGCPFVIVIGHADFYPRFGFTPASRQGITCEWDVPPEAFMIKVLNTPMQPVSGEARYRPEFSTVS